MFLRVVRFTDVTAKARVESLLARIDETGPPPGVPIKKLQLVFDEDPGHSRRSPVLRRRGELPGRVGGLRRDGSVRDTRQSRLGGHGRAQGRARALGRGAVACASISLRDRRSGDHRTRRRSAPFPPGTPLPEDPALLRLPRSSIGRAGDMASEAPLVGVGSEVPALPRRGVDSWPSPRRRRRTRSGKSREQRRVKREQTGDTAEAEARAPQASERIDEEQIRSASVNPGAALLS